MLDYRIYQDCFSTAEMRSIWCENAVVSAWLKVEQVLIRCQADIGIVPDEAAEALEAIALADLDIVELAEEMTLVGRPIVGLVKQLRRLTGEHAQHVHLKTTTQDIMDTAMVMQMKLGLENIREGVVSIIGAVERHIEANPETMIMGRTNGQHAVPMKLATKLGVWNAELNRRLEALDQAAARGINVQIGRTCR